MKKMFFSIMLALALLVMLTGIALANGGPHGGFTATTDACAGCHRAHTATNARLLTVNPSTLCTSCHGSTATGANTNVDDGKYLSTRDDAGGNWNHGAANTPDNSNLLGGGFVTYKGVATTSNHTIGLANSWGQGASDRGTATALAGGATLQCVSCHDPHGNTNYRIIRTTVNTAAVTVALVDEGAAKDYDTEQWGAGQSTVCAACHVAYHKTAAGQGSTLDGTTYTHRIDMAWNGPLPIGVTVGANNPETLGYDGVAATGDEIPLAGANLVCQSCHLPHGTNSTVSALAQGPYTADSTLLRLNNRGVCQSCHQK
jgi:predicted CXXCH cytochrome family protein